MHVACRGISDIRDVSSRAAGGTTVPVLCPDALMATSACSAFALDQLSILHNNKPPHKHSFISSRSRSSKLSEYNQIQRERQIPLLFGGTSGELDVCHLLKYSNTCLQKLEDWADVGGWWLCREPDTDQVICLGSTNSHSSRNAEYLILHH